MMLRLLRPLSLALALALSAPQADAADHAAASETIWPTQNDIAQTTGDGKKLLENQWAKPLAVLAPNNFALSGLTVPGTSGSLSISVASGSAYIAGRHITIPGSTSVTAAASSVNHVFLKLTRDGSNLVTGGSFEVNITGVAPADSIAIATLTAGASTITATSDRRILPATSLVLSSGSEWTVPAGIARIYVEVFGSGGGGGGGGGSGGSSGPAGGVGGTGGATSFSGLSTTGGSGGIGGNGSSATGAATGGSHGVGTSAHVALTSHGLAGGGPGNGCSVSASPGGPGGHGGYAAGPMSVTQDADITYAIGAAGTAGAGGVGTGTSACTGGAGQAGLAGRIVIHY